MCNKLVNQGVKVSAKLSIIIDCIFDGSFSIFKFIDFFDFVAKKEDSLYIIILSPLCKGTIFMK